MRKGIPLLNIIFFLVTTFTMVVSGAVIAPGSPEGFKDTIFWLLNSPVHLLFGFPIAASLIFILLSHEAGHYILCEKYGVRATLPYFIPAPPFFSLGTFGAFIRIKSAIPTRSSLIQIGSMGPILGFISSILVYSIGLFFFKFGYIQLEINEIVGKLNLPIAPAVMFRVFIGHWPEASEGIGNPLLLSAWLGFFAQGLNLIPAGQLDGGHILYGLFKERHRYVSMAVVIACIALGFLMPFWWFWGVLILLIGFRHPPTLFDAIPLNKKDKIKSWLCFIILLVSFHPVPINN